MGFVFFLLLIVLQYAVAFFSLKEKAWTVFAGVLAYATISYDFVFIQASYYIPEALLAGFRPFNEYLLLYFLLQLTVVRRRALSFPNREDLLAAGLLLLPSGLMLLHDIADFHPGDTLRGLRMYLLPLLLPYLLYRCGVFDRIRVGRLLQGLLGLVLLAALFGLVQWLRFDGEIRQLWFYEYFNRFGANPLIYGRANYVRSGQLRATGIFDSPIAFALVLGMAVLLIASLLLQSGAGLRRRDRGWLLVAGVFLLACLPLAQTRVGFLVPAIGMLILLLERFRKLRFPGLQEASPRKAPRWGGWTSSESFCSASPPPASASTATTCSPTWMATTSPFSCSSGCWLRLRCSGSGCSFIASTAATGSKPPDASRCPCWPWPAASCMLSDSST
jgi:hypothetical protein